MANQAFDTKNSLGQAAVATSASGTNWLPLLSANLSAPIHVAALYLANTDTVDHLVDFGLYNAGGSPSGSVFIFAVTVPAGAGAGTVAIVEAVLAGLGSGASGFHFWDISSLAWSIEEAIGEGKMVTCFIQAGEL